MNDPTHRLSAAAAHRVQLEQSGATTAYRLIHGAEDGQPGIFVDRLGDHMLIQSEGEWDKRLERVTTKLVDQLTIEGAYYKQLDRHIRSHASNDLSPTHVQGSPAPPTFEVTENQVRYQLSLQEGYSTGIFLDQRENRERLLQSNRGNRTQKNPASCLNLFAYTCAFSVCAALSGATVTSVDLSKKYLDWGKENFRLNNIDPDEHEFIFGDAFDWLKRLKKKGRAFDLILIDPPTFSKSKKSGLFKAKKDYPKLVANSLELLSSGGELFCSSNTASWSRRSFESTIDNAIAAEGRKITKREFVGQPADFPCQSKEPPYLKTCWRTIS